MSDSHEPSQVDESGDGGEDSGEPLERRAAASALLAEDAPGLHVCTARSTRADLSN
jgi:hypothetical protein